MHLDQAAAAGWHSKVIVYRGATLQLLCPVIMEREDLPSDTTTIRPHNRGLLQYQLRVLANGVSAGTVQAILSSRVTCTVTSVTRGLPSATDAYVSNYFVVSFDTATCPDQLKLVTHVSMIGESFFIHHHREFQRVSCFNCHSPFHSSAKCASRPGARLLDHLREYTRKSHSSILLLELNFAHLDVAGRMKHVINMTDCLAASTAKLQADARKALLLQKLQKSPVPELDRMKTSASATDCQNQTEYDEDFARNLEAGDWFDPGGNKKPRKQRKSSNSLGQATAMGKLQQHAHVQQSPASSSRILPRATASTSPTQATSGQGTKPVSSLATSKARQEGVKPKAAYKKPPTNTSTSVSRRVTALAKLNQLLTDDSLEPNPTARTVSSGAVETSPTGATAQTVAQDEVDQAKLRVIALQAAAEEEILIASETKAK